MSGGKASQSQGFTKAAQSAKFIRHRDIKMKESELKREEHVKHAMSEGICDRCRDKVQWRFKYDKYKSLTKPGTCQGCKNKTVTKAYRSLCDLCATKRKVCPSCSLVSIFRFINTNIPFYTHV